MVDCRQGVDTQSVLNPIPVETQNLDRIDPSKRISSKIPPQTRDLILAFKKVAHQNGQTCRETRRVSVARKVWF